MEQNEIAGLNPTSCQPYDFYKKSHDGVSTKMKMR